jgi:hypothetical protein
MADFSFLNGDGGEGGGERVEKNSKWPTCKPFLLLRIAAKNSAGKMAPRAASEKKFSLVCNTSPSRRR